MSLKDWEGRVLSAPGASERVRSAEEKVLSHIRYRIRRRVKLRLFWLKCTKRCPEGVCAGHTRENMTWKFWIQNRTWKFWIQNRTWKFWTQNRDRE